MVIQPGGSTVGGSASGTSSAAIAIPPLSNTNNPQWVVLVNFGTNSMSFLFGQSGVAAAEMTTGIGVPADSMVAVNVAGNTHFRVISNAGTPAYQVIPLAGIPYGR